MLPLQKLSASFSCVFRVGGGENFYCLTDHHFPISLFPFLEELANHLYVSQELAEVGKEEKKCVYMCIYIFFPCVINTILKINYLLLFLPRYSFLPSLFWDWPHSMIESIIFQTSPSSDKPTEIDLYQKNLKFK